jgi:tryptophan synthase beta subunit
MTPRARLPDSQGHFGRYGGRFVPETHAYGAARLDPAFRARLRSLLAMYAGRPTPLYFAARLTEHCGGARLFLKREDLCHTGAHKINNVLGQALVTTKPICVGFGISRPEPAATAGALADGVSVGSAIVRLVEERAASATLVSDVGRFVASLKAALRGARRAVAGEERSGDDP